MKTLNSKLTPLAVRSDSISVVLKAIFFTIVMILASKSFGQVSIGVKPRSQDSVQNVRHTRVFDQNKPVCDEVAARLQRYGGANARIMENAFNWTIAKSAKSIASGGVWKKWALIDINNDGSAERVSRFGDWEGYISDKHRVKDVWASLEFNLNVKPLKLADGTTFAIESYGYNLRHVPRTKYPTGAFSDPKTDLRQDEDLPWKVLGDPRYEATLVTGFYPILVKGLVFLVLKTSDDTGEPNAGEYPFRRWIIVTRVRPGLVQATFHESLPDHLDDICYFIESDVTARK